MFRFVFLFVLKMCNSDWNCPLIALIMRFFLACTDFCINLCKFDVNQMCIRDSAGCPGSKSMQIQRSEIPKSEKPSSTAGQVSNLQNWPVQIKLAPVSAPYFNGAKLLIAADCAAYAYAGFHQDFIRNKVTLIGCPKLDQVDYSEKLTAIIQNNDIQSVTIVRTVSYTHLSEY